MWLPVSGGARAEDRDKRGGGTSEFGRRAVRERAARRSSGEQRKTRGGRVGRDPLRLHFRSVSSDAVGSRDLSMKYSPIGLVLHISARLIGT